MGLECTHQALPAGCALLERAKRDFEFGELLSLLSWSPERLQRRWEEGGVSAEFAEEVLRLSRLHPGIEARCYDVARDWDVLARPALGVTETRHRRRR